MGRRSRRRIGSRHYKNYSKEMLEIAIDLVKKKQISSLEAEKRFYIPRRTIENKVKGLHTKPPGGQQRLSYAEEKDIVDVLVASADFGSPLTRLDLRILIFEYLNKNRRTYLFNDKLPGKWWVKHFLDRHRDKLTERSVQNIKKARAEKTMEEFENYFENLKHTLKDVPPTNILNYDESNLSDNPGSTKCIFKRKVKYPERILNHSKGNISIMFAASADGRLLPVYTVYKSEHLWSNWCLNSPSEARYNRTKSGWFDARVFEDWFESTVIPWAKKLQGPKVVIGDNLSSHLNVNIIRLCEQNEIRFAFLPPNSTHVTQPLDVAYFGPLKKCWRQILTEYKIKNPSEAQINKSHFPILLKQLLENIEVSNNDNIKAGFRATGIVPLNPNKVLSKLPEFEPETRYKIDIALLDYLKKSKAPNPIKKTGVNRKLQVEPGTSISSKDLEILMANVKRRSQKKEFSNSKSNKSKPDKTTTEQNQVTYLSDIRHLPENQAHMDVRHCSTLKLTKQDLQRNVPTARKNKKNTDPWTNPVASTSGTCKTIKTKSPNRKLKQSKRLKFKQDSDDSDDDNYSLRDTSEEEMIMSESEDPEGGNLEGEINTNQRKRTKRLKEENQAAKSSRRTKKRKVDISCSGEENSDSSEDVYLSVYKNQNSNKSMELKACDRNDDKIWNEDLGSFMGNQNIVTKLNKDIDINNIENFIEIDENGEIMEYDTCFWAENNKIIEELDLNQMNQNETIESRLMDSTETDENNTQIADNVLTGEKISTTNISAEHKVVTNSVTAEQTEVKKTTAKQKITVLSEIRNTLENKIVVDIKTLKRVPKTVDLFKIGSTHKYKENNQTESQMCNLKQISHETNQSQTKQFEEVEKPELPEIKQNSTEEGAVLEKPELSEKNQKKDSQIKDEEKTDSPETIQNKTEEGQEVERPDLSETKQNKTEESKIQKLDSPEANQNKTEVREEVEKQDFYKTKQNRTEESEEVDKPDLSETNQNKTESSEVEKPDSFETNQNKIKEEERDYDIKSIVVNQNVLVRYYIRTKWKYYIGFVEKIDNREETYYTVHYLKTVKKPNLKFIVTKNDRDIVPATSIVKIVQLYSIKENKEYCLIDSFDEVYF